MIPHPQRTARPTTPAQCLALFPSPMARAHTPAPLPLPCRLQPHPPPFSLPRSPCRRLAAWLPMCPACAQSPSGALVCPALTGVLPRRSTSPTPARTQPCCLAACRVLTRVPPRPARHLALPRSIHCIAAAPLPALPPGHDTAPPSRHRTGLLACVALQPCRCLSSGSGTVKRLEDSGRGQSSRVVGW